MSAHNKDCYDCYRLTDSELCHECVGINKSYNCKWSEELDSCTNCSFCQSCFGCIDCLGCVNQVNKKYCIFNKQYGREEYLEKVKEFKLETHEGQQKTKKQAEEFWLKAPKREYHGHSLNKNVSGEYIYESKNTHDSFLVKGAEDCRFVQYLSLKTSKDCYDYTGWGAGSSLLYECYIVGEGAYNNKFCCECWPEARDSEYCFYSVQSKDCFACVNLKRKKYCILNKQYTPEEYFKLKEKIISDMKKNPWRNKAGHIYTYGEFLPPELSPYSYDETMSFEYNPLSKEEAEKQGFNWLETKKNVYHPTMENKSLPETISETSPDIQEEVIQCNTCNKSYNINIVELELLQKLNQPIPHSCPNCRYERKFNRTNKPILYDRNCMKCEKVIKTPYAPSRPETIYCEKCYQQEVY